MTIGAQVQLGVRPGYATATTCKMVVASLAAGDVTISGSWGAGTFAITMSAIGAVGYTGSTTITGLTGFTRYTYTVTQGAKTSSGSFMTAPSDTDDFSLFFASCDPNQAPVTNTTGFWGFVQDYVQNGALPTAGMVFIDDHGYVDGCLVDDSAGTGLTVSNLTYGPQFSGDVADYAIAYMACLGMLQDTGSVQVAWGRDTARVYCNQNVNYLPQWGDHEFINDFGFRYNKTTATSLMGVGSATGAQVWAGGKSAWDAFLFPLTPAPLNAAHSYGWGMSLGCLSIVAPDSITNADGTWDTATAPGTGEITTLYGSAQIDDILTFLNTNQKPFNLFSMANGIRYLKAFEAGVGAVYNQGAQCPLADHLPTEYSQLFTATGNSPKSVMDSSATNGVRGVTVLLHGDYHHQCAIKHEKSAYAGNASENLYSVYLGTIGGSVNFNMPISEGASYGGSTLEYGSGWTNPARDFGGMRIDVYGSYSTKEMHVILFDSAGLEVWRGRFLQNSSNSSVPTTYAKPVVRPATKMLR